MKLEECRSRLWSFREIQRYTEKQDANVSKEKSVQSVYSTCNDIWVSNLGNYKKNAGYAKDNSEKHGKSND